MQQNLKNNDILKLYKQLLTVRLFEEKAAELYMQGHIYGFCHLYIGQEAIAVGVNHNINKELDTQITSYRDHGHMLIVGVDPKYVMAELCGKDTGCSKGKGGSMHMYSKKHNFYGGNGIVGAQVSIGTGLAFSHKYKEDGGVAVIYMGDGAINQGQVYESFNMASLWNLPAVYIIEDNQYAMGTHKSRAIAGGSLKTRGDSFGIPCIEADGMNLFDVIDKSKQALEYARRGDGPIIIHTDTYRYKGHSMSDSATYRTREEVDNVRKNRDPVQLVRNFLKNTVNFDEIEEEITKIVLEAAEFAINSTEPDEKELMTDIYHATLHGDVL
ncbi:MAG: pyruvate dehydrogenase (acetyl-transferring) E1 component subunit alpha [Holosporales bacterium]|jgi:pyruvate dehydrogenase E1 component alpha subunit|nr:pyruvate dehydrogenase (acetyl-transferring) E1 component subunit alpha [Holosporales bacterium]